MAYKLYANDNGMINVAGFPYQKGQLRAIPAGPDDYSRLTVSTVDDALLASDGYDQFEDESGTPFASASDLKTFVEENFFRNASVGGALNDADTLQPPTGISATPDDSSLEIDGTDAPAPADGYRGHATPNADWSGGVYANGSSLPVAIPGLTNNVPHYYRIRATKSGYYPSVWVEGAGTVTPAILTAPTFAIVAATSADWTIATITGTADSYNIYRNTVNDSSTAELIWSGTATTIPFLPMLAGETNYLWATGMYGATETGFSVVDSFVAPANAQTIKILGGPGDSNEFAIFPAGGSTPSVDGGFLSMLEDDGYTINRQALPGTTIQDWSELLYELRVERQRDSSKRNIAITLLGTNDHIIVAADPSAEIAAFEALNDRVFRDGFQILMIAPPAYDLSTEAAFQQYSDLMKANKTALHASDVVSFRDYPEIAINNAGNAAYWYDLAHINNLGHAVLYTGILPAIQEIENTWSKKAATPTTPVNSGAGATNAFSATLQIGCDYTMAEGTVDGGITWEDCTSGAGRVATFAIGNTHREAGLVGIRVKALWGGPNMQYNSPGEALFNTVAFTTSFTETVVAYNNAAITYVGSAWTDAGIIMREDNSVTDGSCYYEVDFTKGIQVTKWPLYANTQWRFEVDGVVIDTVRKSNTTTGAFQVYFDYKSGDSATHTLKVYAHGDSAHLGAPLYCNGVMLYS